jgi:glycine cleavage system H protein
MNVPAGLSYTSHDEWVKVEGDLATGITVTVGITDYAQDQLGELVHVELPAVGKKVTAGAVVCEVESVKAVAEIYSPVAGEVVEVNAALEDGAEAINKDPYGSWIYKLRASGAPAGLLSAADYQKKIG